MMKIKYQISKTANLQPSYVQEKILTVLDKPGYVILKKTNNSIEFNHNIWRIGSRMEAYGMVDGGRFAIDTKSEGSVVYFDYYVSPLFWILFVCFFLFLGITQEVHILYAIPLVFIFFGFHVWNVKIAAKEMMKRILSAENP